MLAGLAFLPTFSARADGSGEKGETCLWKEGGLPGGETLNEERKEDCELSGSRKKKK